jgi:hypothetical protein
MPNLIKYLVSSLCISTLCFIAMAIAIFMFAILIQNNIFIINGTYLFAFLLTMAILFIIDQIIIRFFWMRIINQETLKELNRLSGARRRDKNRH